MRIRRSNKARSRSHMPLGANIALLVGVAMVAAGGIGFLLWLLFGRPSIRLASGWTAANSLDFTKIVLTVLGGVGGVAALVIAYRKQRLGEAAEQREDIKLFSERFTRAAEQLGSDKAPVRLAGIHALEDLAQGTVGQRQTIVNVLCAYLRMPIFPPDSDRSTSRDSVEQASPPRTDANANNTSAQAANKDDSERRQQEHEVRMTAQRVLAVHLRPGGEPERQADIFWKDIDLDLTGATLFDFDLSRCHMRVAHFDRVKFVGDANFRGSVFWTDARFDQVEFADNARFSGAVFNGIAWFVRATFRSTTTFARARFCKDAVFDGALFKESMMFRVASEFGRTGFGLDRAELGETKALDNSTGFVGGSAWFGGAEFEGNAFFRGAIFASTGWFDEVEFSRDAIFDRVAFREGDYDTLSIRFDETKFGGYASFEWVIFGATVRFDHAHFGGACSFDGARVSLEDVRSTARTWPEGVTVAAPRADEKEGHPGLIGQKGKWGYLKIDTSNESRAELPK